MAEALGGPVEVVERAADRLAALHRRPEPQPESA
jgi:hypothetical protein